MNFITQYKVICSPADYPCFTSQALDLWKYKFNNYYNGQDHSIYANQEIEKSAWIGAGVPIIPGIRIGEWSTIGAGAVVIRDIPDGAVMAGVPAKVIKYKPGYSPD